MNRKTNGIMGLRKHPHASARSPTVTFDNENKSTPHRGTTRHWICSGGSHRRRGSISIFLGTMHSETSGTRLTWMPSWLELTIYELSEISAGLGVEPRTAKSESRASVPNPRLRRAKVMAAGAGSWADRGNFHPTSM